MMMSNSSMKYYAPVGRVLLSLLFIVSGWGVLMNFAGTQSMIAGVGVPMAALATAIVIFLKR